MAYETLPRHKLFNIHNSGSTDVKQISTNEDSISVHIKKDEKVLFHKDYTEFKNPIVLTDPDLSYGYIYKENKNLLWQYNEEEPINLTNVSESNNTQINNTLNKFDEKINKFDEKINQLESNNTQINNTSNKFETLQDLINSVKEKCDQLDVSCNDKNFSVFGSLQDLNSKYSSVQLDINKLSSALNSTKNQIAEQYNYENKKVIELMQTELSNINEKILKNQEAYQNIFHLDMNSQIAELKNEAQEKYKHYDKHLELLNNISEYKKTADLSFNTISDLSLLVEYNTTETEKINKKLENSQNETEQINKKLENSQNETDQINKKLENSQNETDQINKKLENSQNETEQIKKQIQSDIEQLNQKIQTISDVLNIQNSKLSNSLASFLSEEIETKLSEQNDKLSTQLKKYNDTINNKQDKIENIITEEINKSKVKNMFEYKNVKYGDVVGVNFEGIVEKISGCHWDNILNTETNKITFYTYNSKNIFIFYEDTTLEIFDMIGKSLNKIKLNIKLNSDSKITFIKNDNQANFSTNLSSNLSSNLSTNLSSNLSEYSFDIMILPSIEDNVFYLTKIININNELKIEKKSFDYTSLNEQIVDFDILYDENIKTLILCLFVYEKEFSVNNKIIISLLNSSNLEIGYTNQNVLKDIILEKNNNIKIIPIPGNNILISYHNIKFFVLLPSNYNDAFSVSIPYINNDSITCYDILYVDGNIVSVEKNIANSYFLCLMDIKGLELKQLQCKIIENPNIKFVSILKDYSANGFVLFYTKKNKLYIQTINSSTNNIKFKVNYYVNTDCKNFKIFEFMKSYIIFMQNVNNLEIRYFNNHYGLDPKSFIGIVENINSDSAELVLKGNVFQSNHNYPNSYIGKKIYFVFDKEFPDNLSVDNDSNVFIGTCISKNKILIR